MGCVILSCTFSLVFLDDSPFGFGMTGISVDAISLFFFQLILLTFIFKLTQIDSFYFWLVRFSALNFWIANFKIKLIFLSRVSENTLIFSLIIYLVDIHM